MRNKASFFILILFSLFQSCAVYEHSPVSRYEAMGKGKVKIYDIRANKYKFSNIVKIDSVYYGVGREYLSETNYITRSNSKTPLDSIMVSQIFIKKTKQSSLGTLIITIGVLFFIYLLI